jgi:hypothetical protein
LPIHASLGALCFKYLRQTVRDNKNYGKQSKILIKYESCWKYKAKCSKQHTPTSAKFPISTGQGYW